MTDSLFRVLPTKERNHAVERQRTSHRITESLRDYVGSKLAKLERHFDHLTDIHCVLTVEKLQQQKPKPPFTWEAERFTPIRSKPNMYAAIDILVDKLDRQVKRHKEKLTDHHAREVERFR